MSLSTSSSLELLVLPQFCAVCSFADSLELISHPSLGGSEYTKAKVTKPLHRQGCRARGQLFPDSVLILITFKYLSICLNRTALTTDTLVCIVLRVFPISRIPGFEQKQITYSELLQQSQVRPIRLSKHRRQI